MSLPFSQGHPVESKVKAVPTAGAAALLLVWVLDYFFKIEMPVEVAGAVVIVFAAVAAYFAPHTQRVYKWTDHKRA